MIGEKQSEKLWWGSFLGLIMLLWLGIGPSALATSFANDPFAPQVFITNLDVASGDSVLLDLQVPVPPGHYVYADKLSLTWNDTHDFAVQALELPSAVTKYDAFMDKELAIYEHPLQLGANIAVPEGTAPGRYVMTASLRYQGCSPTLCYRGMTHQLAWTLIVDGGGEARLTQSGEPPRSILPAIAEGAADIFTQGSAAAYFFTFVGGFATGFTPCILPLLPVVLLIIGVNAGNIRRNFMLSLSLATGLATTYAIIGVVGAQLGKPVGFLFQQPWFLVLLVLFFLAMAASMFGLFSLQLPSSWQLRLQQVGGVGPRGAFIAGMSTGVLATPCAGPVVAALVAHVGVQGDVWHGLSLLFAYGAGLGALFVLVGTFYGQLASRLPKGQGLVWVKRLLGLLLLLPALYYGWVLSASFGSETGMHGDWHTDEAAAFALAQERQLPVLIEFTAKTCPPCLVMEQTTFVDEAVRASLREDIVPLRIDTTTLNTTKESQIARYGVVGWPTLLFVSPDGDVWPELTLVGRVVPAKELLAQIARAKAMLR